MSLRLAAEDEEDLKILSAAVQDAVLTLGDIAYDPRGRVVTLGLNRFRWESQGKSGERIRSGLQIASVLGVASRKLRRAGGGGLPAVDRLRSGRSARRNDQSDLRRRRRPSAAGRMY